MKSLQLFFVSAIPKSLRVGAKIDSTTHYEPVRNNQSSPANHLLYLDGLRALCALYVVIHHALTQSSVQSGAAFNLLNKVFCKGHFAVDFFIVLSGFCLMLPVVKNGNTLKGSVMNFIKKRVRRILPTYYLAMALSLLLIYTLIGEPTGTHWDVSIPVSTADIVAHLVLVQDIFGGTSAKINHAFWSIAVEWRIYFFFPVLIYAFKRWGALITAAITLAVSIGAWLFIKKFTSFNASPWGINPHYLGLFTMGMLAASVSYSGNKKFNQLSPAMLLTVAIMLLAAAYKTDVYKWGLWIVADVAVGVACCILLFLLTSKKISFLNNALSWKPLAATGVFAYSIYLVHAPLLEVFSRYVLLPLNLTKTVYVTTYILVGAPIIVACSYLFFLVAEKPFMTKKTLKAA